MNTTKIFKKIKVTPNDWMKIYEGRKGELVFHEIPPFKVGDRIFLIPFNTATKKELKGLPRLERTILEIVKGSEFVVKISGDNI